MSWGPLIHGHAPSGLVKAVAAAARAGTSYGAPSPLEVELGERVRRLMPALEAWRQRNSAVELIGPLPPDTCWLEAGAAWHGSGQSAADGFLALYHDQGLLPVKLLAFDAAVNTTLELPFLRTSPDHGTGQAIAGLGVARATSMKAAIETAWELG